MEFSWEGRCIIRCRVVDPARRWDGLATLLFEDGILRLFGVEREDLPESLLSSPGVSLIDDPGLMLLPGLFDMHAHLRVPGQEWKEDLVTGTAAAAAGGFTGVLAMANTDPPLDRGPLVEGLLGRAAREALVPVWVAGCLTRGREGKEVAPLGELARAGAIAFSDDGNPVEDYRVMRLALRYASFFGRPVIVHAAEPGSGGGVVHGGRVADLLGLPGSPSSYEAALSFRDALLAGETGARVHIAHVSARETLEVLRLAKEQGWLVTAEATPHHLALSEDYFLHHPFDPAAKVNPPLRAEEDRAALLEAVRTGLVEVIATDHAPHHRDEKEVEFERAAFGTPGLETALGVVLSLGLPPLRVAEAMSLFPRRLLGLGGGTFVPGERADFVLLDPEAEWVCRPEEFRSKARYSPFAGKRLRGRVLLTVAGGKVVFSRRPFCPPGAGERRAASLPVAGGGGGELR